jgi:hypothetical protein
MYNGYRKSARRQPYADSSLFSITVIHNPSARFPLTALSGPVLPPEPVSSVSDFRNAL